MGFTNKYVYRFTPAQIEELLEAFQLENVEYNRRYKPIPKLSMCIALHILAYPSRLRQAQLLVGRSNTYNISIVFATVSKYLERRYRKVADWYPTLTYDAMKLYSTKLEQASPHTKKIFGFIDDTFREICQPNYYKYTR